MTVRGPTEVCHSLPRFMTPSTVCKMALCAVTLTALAQLPFADAEPVSMAAAVAATPSVAIALKTAGVFLLGLNPATWIVASGVLFTGYVICQLGAPPPPSGLSDSESAAILIRELGIDPRLAFDDGGVSGIGFLPS